MLFAPWQTKCHEQKLIRPQFPARTFKAEMMPAGKRLMSALRAPCKDKEAFVFS